MVGEHETVVAGGLAHNVHRGALAPGHTLHIGYVSGVNYQAHALLALVAHNLLGREGLVAHGKGIEVDMSAGLLDKLRESVEMSAGAMVVN